MRGEHQDRHSVHRVLAGIIPACAGSTATDSWDDRQWQGSSPHARGAPKTLSNVKRVARIIPACAGSTQASPVPSLSARGSSPHARGARNVKSASSISAWDHPRMRGEHPLATLYNGHVLGIIPACAGSTRNMKPCESVARGSSPHARGAQRSVTFMLAPRRDHPRMRGEHHCNGCGHEFGHGIIPACAGSTQMNGLAGRHVMGSSPHARGARPTTAKSARSWRDHPRMRGEHCTGICGG